MRLTSDIVFGKQLSHAVRVRQAVVHTRRVPQSSIQVAVDHPIRRLHQVFARDRSRIETLLNQRLVNAVNVARGHVHERFKFAHVATQFDHRHHGQAVRVESFLHGIEVRHDSGAVDDDVHLSDKPLSIVLRQPQS